MATDRDGTYTPGAALSGATATGKRGPKPKVKAKAKAIAGGAADAAVPAPDTNPTPKKPKAPPTLVSSLVRGANMVSMMTTWNAMRDRMHKVVSDHLVMLSLDDVEQVTPERAAQWDRNMQRNAKFLEVFMCYTNNKDKSIDRSCERLLETCGRGDMAASEMLVQIPNQYYNSLEEAVTGTVALVRHIFLGRKPPTPAEGRWTGVPGAAAFFGSLLFFCFSLPSLIAGEAVAPKKRKKPVAVEPELNEDQD